VAKLEGLFDAALSDAEKKVLRRAMDARFAGTARGAAAKAAFDAVKRSSEIHHRLPLEWAHKLPGADPNSGANLIALEKTVHQSGKRSAGELPETFDAEKQAAAQVFKSAWTEYEAMGYTRAQGEPSASCSLPTVPAWR
jgi:hypothetical protein